MPYSSRWICIVILNISVFLAGFFYDLYPEWSKLNTLLSTKKHLENEWVAVKKRVKQNRKAEKNYIFQQPKNEFSPSQMMTFAHSKGVVIESVQAFLSEDTKIQNEGRVRLVGYASFESLESFLFSLFTQDYFVSVSDFSCEINQDNKLHFKVNLFVPKITIENQINKNDKKSLSPLFLKETSLSSNPFCFLNEGLISHDERTEQLRSVPLQQMQMVGVIQKRDHIESLLLLGHGSLAAVHVGAVIGQEEGIVDHIFKNQTIVLLPNKKLFIFDLKI